MPHNGYGLTTTPLWGDRPTGGDRRHHTGYEAEPMSNGCVVLVSNNPTNGGNFPQFTLGLTESKIIERLDQNDDM